MRTATWRSSGLSAGTFVEITNLYLLVVAALGAGERAYLAGAEGWDYGGLVPVEDVAAFFALLPEGDDRAPFDHDLAPRHLYRHCCSLPTKRGPRTDCTPTMPLLARRLWC